MRYLLVGGSVYVLELVVIALGQGGGLSAVRAVALAFVVGTAVSFGLQKFVTFGDRRTHARVLAPQIVATVALVLFNLGFSVALTALLQKHLPAVVIRTIALSITTIWNFYLYKTHIFAGNQELVS